jgi:putative ABC transport system permease protein
MVKNYLKVAWRNLTKHRFYSLINIIGLAIGLACTLLIIVYVQNELTYDQHHSKADRIYRIATEIKFGGRHFNMPQGPAPMAAAVSADYPEVEASVRLREQGRFLVKIEEQTFREEGLVFADSSIFTVFDIPLIAGATSALDRPNSIIIDQPTAEKYFGAENPIGKRLLLDNDLDVEVTGVFAPIPVNSHFHYNLILSMSSSEHSKSTMWLSNNYTTYVLLAPNTNPAAFEVKFPGMIEKYIGPQVTQALDMTLEEFFSSGSMYRYYLQPLTDIHLYSTLDNELEPNGDIRYVYLFGGIALLILTLACINFMNLSTARSANRAKEVGVRKVLGSSRSHLIKQFLSESILISVIATIAAVLLAQLMLPAFNLLADKTLVLPYTAASFYLTLFAGALFIGTIAGVYPAFFLSAFQPISVLKGKLNLGVKSGWLRSTLVVFQFAISTILIVGTLVIYMQLNYIQNKKLGFSKDQLILIEDAYALQDNLQPYKKDVTNIAGVQSVSASGFLPVSSNRSDTMFWLEGQTPNEETMISMQIWRIDEDYLKTMGMELAEGRNFSLVNAADSTAMIVNQEAAKKLGISDNPIGAHVATFSDMQEGDKPGEEIYNVIGVIEDFHFESLKESITPLCLVIGKSSSYLSVKVEGGDVKHVLGQLEERWNVLAEGQPFSYSFMDQKFDDMYTAEARTGNLFNAFAILAILIASLGLFALAAFTAEQRTKEIGVRKVMGASVGGIVVLLSKEFGKLIIIAFIVAVPVAWYFTSQWLQDFEFRIDLSPWIFLLAGTVTFGIAWLTMSYQSIKAATMSPAKSLRDE